MKLKIVAIAFAVAGLGTSVAVAKSPAPGGRGETSATATATERKLKVCHRTLAASRPFRMILVSRAALETHMRHGDLLAPGSGACPTTTTSAAP
jgi:hypothetical protein